MKARLEVRPVKNYQEPKYPTKAAVVLDPSVLRALPRRWSARPAVCAALALTLATGLYSCSRADPDNLPVGGAESLETGLAIPIFEHGNGRSSFGCVSVAPPVFLSEDEAAQVIREEAAKYGIDFSGEKSIEGRFPTTNLYGDQSLADATWEGSLELDGYDSSLGVGFEFVSQSDVNMWQITGNMWVSVEMFDMKGTATRLADATRNVVVFYDPGKDNSIEFKRDTDEDYATYRARYEAEQKAQMHENLRAQVRDFLEWLAAQGVI